MSNIDTIQEYRPRCWKSIYNEKPTVNFFILLDENIPSHQAGSHQGKYTRYKDKRLVNFQEYVRMIVESLIRQHDITEIFPIHGDVRMDIYITPKNMVTEQIC